MAKHLFLTLVLCALLACAVQSRDADDVLNNLVNDLDADVSQFVDPADVDTPEDFSDHIPADWSEDGSETDSDEDSDITADEEEDVQGNVRDGLVEYFKKKIATAVRHMKELKKQDDQLAEILDRLEAAAEAARRDEAAKKDDLAATEGRCSVARRVAAKRKEAREGEIKIVRMLISKVDELHSKDWDKSSAEELAQIAKSAMNLMGEDDIQQGDEPDAQFSSVMADLSEGRRHNESVEVRGLLIKLLNGLVTEANKEDKDEKRECGKITAAKKFVEMARHQCERTNQSKMGSKLSRERVRTQIRDARKNIDELTLEAEKVSRPGGSRKKLEAERKAKEEAQKEVERLKKELELLKGRLTNNHVGKTRGLGDATNPVTNGIKSWMSADNKDKIKRDNKNGVIQWRDNSPKGNVLSQEDENKRPKYGAHCGPGGTPCIRFDGVNDILTNRGFRHAGGPISIHAVFRLRDFTKHKNYPFGLGDHDPNFMGIETEGSNKKLDIAFGHGNDKAFDMPESWNGKGYRRFSITANTKNDIVVEVDGQKAAMSKSPSGNIPDLKRMYLGGLDFSISHATRNTPVDFSEIIVYDRKLTADEDDKVQKYLEKKWLSNGGDTEVSFKKYNEQGRALDEVNEQLNQCRKESSGGKALGEDEKNPAESCNTIRRARPNANLKNGHYWVKSVGGGAHRMYCDMNFRGGGWTLISQSVRGVRDAYNLRQGGGNWRNSPRGKHVWSVPDAKHYARQSKEILIARSDSESYADGIESCSAASYFAIPDPSEVNFANPSYRMNENKGPCVKVKVYNALGNGECKNGCDRFTYKYALGTSWTDGFPTGIGAFPGKCYGPGVTTGPLVTTDDTGTGNPGYINRWGKTSKNSGTTTYWHLGLWDENASSKGGQAMIYVR